jgi:hypothetical protein
MKDARSGSGNAATLLICAALVGAVGCGGGSGGGAETPPPVSDGNDTPATATAITIPSTTNGTLSPSATDVDCYSFTAPGPGTLTFSFFAAGASYPEGIGLVSAAFEGLYLRGPSAYRQANVNGNWGWFVDYSYLTLGPEVFYLVVENNQYDPTPVTTYSFDTSFTPSDGNDTASTATQEVLPFTVTSSALSSVDLDYYEFTTSASGVVVYTLSGLAQSTCLALTGSTPYCGSPSVTVVRQESAGTHVLFVDPRGGATPYTLDAYFVPDDGNGNVPTAAAAALPSTTSGSLSTSEDWDYYKFTVTGAGRVTLALSGLGANADLYLRGPGPTYTQLAQSVTAGTADESIIYDLPGAGTYYVEVSPTAELGATGTNYDLAVSFVSFADGNDTWQLAPTVAVPSTTASDIYGGADIDWFTFMTPTAGQVTVTLSGLSADLDIELYDGALTLRDSATTRGTGTETVTFTAPSGEIYFVKIVPFGAVSSSYSLDVAFTVPPDWNDTQGAATLIALPYYVYLGGLTIAPSGDVDWYWFTTTGPTTITVFLSPHSANLDVELYQGLALRGSGHNLLIYDETISYVAPSAGTFAVKVYSPDASVSDYSIDVYTTP